MKINTAKVQIGPTDNILSIDVPSQLERTIDMGMGFLNDAFGGSGMTPSTSAIFTGTPGAGKTTLMLQAADALTGTGDTIVLYNSNEENLYQVRKVTKRLGLKNGFVPGQERMVPKVLDHARLLQKMHPNKQVVLMMDSIASHDDGKYSNGTNGMTPVRVVEQVTEWCKDTYGIAIMIGHVTKSGEFAGKQEMKHIVDVHAHLWIDMKQQSETYGERLFEIQKNRFGFAYRTYVLAIGEHGLKEKAVLS